MTYNAIEEYKNYINTSLHKDESKSFDRYHVFSEMAKQFSIKKAMYPGSYIHITPSFIIPEVIYVDTDKKALKFFKNEKEIINYIESNKIYSDRTIVRFEPKDYWMNLSVSKGYCDLLISQYAGFISQACKKYLKKGGVLLANDSHGDAAMAYVDAEFEFIGVLEYGNGKYNFSNEDLERYFTFKRDRPIDITKVKKLMKGPRYKHTAEYYIFEKISD
ncbi:hypothetical protein [Alkaliphilus hydrothermalis]|uniref:Class I SAM-dependent methyltransferase n=1 Tax=Alkaliphilus hydrothermalis TaxID=1482730 RepID=A0ABS2NMI8_9FIRM|nr:hypothetical protein [Alkaliphilus hydrothermalis]MBM7614160.1 hypothetical protein [Alkaliphilus hydrothermalis]